ncbi:MAG: flavin reductase family protein [Nevskiales bacterium]|nr:flavin reductase family protein [Nevskiales bacterium]
MSNVITRPGPVAPDVFRRAVSKFTTGITVVTAVDDDGVCGMTCNSFTSVSLSPATILVSLRPGRTHAAIARGRRFGVSILRREQQSCSDYFSGAARAGGRPNDIVTRHAAPTLNASLAWFECEVIDDVWVNDHTLFVARVEACGADSGDPLLFFDSGYHHHALSPVQRLPMQ